MSDLDTIRERHEDCDWMGECQDCPDSLGRCDTRVVLDALDETTRFTVDSLAAALHERACHPGDAADHTWCHDEAAAIIQAAKEAELE